MRAVRPGPEPDVVDPTLTAESELDLAVRDLFDRAEACDGAYRGLRERMERLQLELMHSHFRQLFLENRLEELERSWVDRLKEWWSKRVEIDGGAG